MAIQEGARAGRVSGRRLTPHAGPSPRAVTALPPPRSADALLETQETQSRTQKPPPTRTLPPCRSARDVRRGERAGWRVMARGEIAGFGGVGNRKAPASSGGGGVLPFPLFRHPGLACPGAGRGPGARLPWVSREDAKTRRGPHLSSVLVTPDLIRGRAVLEEEPRTASAPPERKRSNKVVSRRDRRGAERRRGALPPLPLPPAQGRGRYRDWGRGAEPPSARMP
jgi:hypothetical protein